jgi:hypothetical protein
MDSRLVISLLTILTALASSRAHSAAAIPEDLAVLPDTATISARTREPVATELASKRVLLSPYRAPQATTFALATNAIKPRAIGTVHLKPFQFTRPTESSVNFQQQPVGVGLPRQFAHIVIALDEHTYDLFFDTEAADPEFAYRHVSMAVLNDPRSRAVFSVDDATGRIFGTLYTPTQAYLFVPLNGSEQIVYRATLPLKGQTANLIGLADPAKDVLARRHSQIDLLARLQPRRAQLLESVRRASLQGGELGRMPTQSAAAFAAIVRNLGVLTHSSGAEQFVLRDSVTNDDGSRSIRFYQTIGGIPVISENRIKVDRAGKVLMLDVQLNDFSAVKPVLSAEDAVASVTSYWERLNGGVVEQVEITEPLALRYLPRNRFESLQLAYVGYLQFDDALPVLARVDAVSGEVELLSLAQTNDIGYSVCVDKSSTGQSIAQDCGFPVGSTTTYYSVDPGSTAHLCPQAGPGICQALIQRTNDIVADIDAKWHAATVNNPHHQCCTQVGGSTHHVNVIRSSRQVINGQDASFYQHPGKVFMNRVAGNNSAEILAHEFAHAQLAYTNDIVYVMSTRFAGAFREGMADTIAGLYGAQAFDPSLFGTQWVHGDGTSYDGSPLRNGTTARTWSYASQTAEIHDGGQTFFNFFKRLADASGASNQRLLGLALEIQATIADKWGDGLDPYDFKDAALGAVQPSETALKNAINTVWDAMYDIVASGPVSPPGPPGEPGPTGAPTFPALVFSTFQYCGVYLGSNVSVFSLGWSTTSNTSEYLGYVKMTSEPLYRYQFSAPHPQAAAVGWSNTTSDFRVRSCNSSGCSGLSLSAASMNQQLQCQ